MDSVVVSRRALEDLLREVGAYLRTQAQSFSRHEAEYKTARDPVSYVDRTAEALLQEGCHRLLPEAGFILEETGLSNSENEFVWVIDPLDGTKNFVHGLPLFGISVALLHRGSPVLGMVYAVPQDELFWAVKGQGAYLGDKRLSVSTYTDPDKLLVVTGFMYRDPERAEKYFQVLVEVMRRYGGLRRLGSAALDLAYVAAGRLDVFYEMDLNPWDVAAGSLLVQEAGGLVTDFTGSPNYLFGTSILAGSAWAHGELLSLLRAYGLQ